MYLYILCVYIYIYIYICADDADVRPQVLGVTWPCAKQ